LWHAGSNPATSTLQQGIGELEMADKNVLDFAAKRTATGLYQSLHRVGDDTTKSQIEALLRDNLDSESYSIVERIFWICTDDALYDDDEFMAAVVRDCVAAGGPKDLQDEYGKPVERGQLSVDETFCGRCGEPLGDHPYGS
jgi:hypothetical protein